MTIKRTGKCEKCQQPCVEVRTFIETVDMFEPETPKGQLSRSMSTQIKDWRKQGMRCDKHQKVAV